jgi:deoxyribodipyrimidine photolyase-related protein
VSVRTLLLVFGDQLDDAVPSRLDLDPETDAIWMAEVAEEIECVPSHKRRIAVFLAAMRHYRERRRDEGWTVHYHELGAEPSGDRGGSFRELLAEDLDDLGPERVVAVLPGDWRVRTMLKELSAEREAEGGAAIELVEDEHHLCSVSDFRAWAEGRKRFLLEDFYRHMRKRDEVLMDGKDPVGGDWNFDKDNRESFGKEGPQDLPEIPRFEPDELTRAVLDLVEARWPDHPGSLEGFAEALTPEQARAALEDFVEHRLPTFGTYQDALWEGTDFLYHSRISVVINLKLLDPREAIEAAEDAYHRGHAPINAVEGFIRQILGWREYIRGIYWTFMPEYAERNALDCDEETDVPVFFWDGDTEMACVRDAMRNVVSHGYAHHIQRLMVLGLFAQLAGVHPYRFHEWHMAMYLDSVDWVSLPNTLGMSQFGDGGLVGSKPYCASGAYIDRQGNHCRNCRYDPKKTEGPRACPFTVLYWDFLARHEERLADNRRMGFQYRNVERRREKGTLDPVLERAEELRAKLAAGERI